MTVLISLNPLNPLVTFLIPFSPDRADLPTSYHPTKKVISGSGSPEDSYVIPQVSPATKNSMANTLNVFILFPLLSLVEKFDEIIIPVVFELTFGYEL